MTGVTMIGNANNSAAFSALHARANLSKLAAENLSDDELIERIAAADDVAMQVLYRRYYDGILHFVSRTLRSTQSAEDVASDVFLDVWRKASSFEGRCEVSTWLFTIARNKSITQLRRAHADPLDDEMMLNIEDDADDPETQIQKCQASSIVRSCLERLSPAHRDVIDLVYFHNKTTGEAAKIAGIARGTVKTRLFYAREKLTELLSAEGIVAAA